jgi:uncharacterized protein (DUF1501 family)
VLDGVNGEIAVQLRTAAKLIRGGLPTKVYMVSGNGFDTHANQATDHPRLMTALDSALTAFQADVGGGTTAVTTLVFSEFGRRVNANASGGTDHGTAGPVLVLGSTVKGGLYGSQPSAGDLTHDGDLKVTTDFRTIYATLLERVLDTDSRGALGRKFTGINFM